MKRDADKAAFVTAELRRAGRRRGRRRRCGRWWTRSAATCASSRRRARSWSADTTGSDRPEVVERYYGGRIEATGFRVADAAVGG